MYLCILWNILYVLTVTACKPLSKTSTTLQKKNKCSGDSTSVLRRVYNFESKQFIICTTQYDLKICFGRPLVLHPEKPEKAKSLFFTIHPKGLDHVIFPFGLSRRRSWFMGKKFLVHIFWTDIKNIHHLTFYWQKIRTFVQRWWWSKHISFHNRANLH